MTTHTDLHPLAQDYLERLYDAARALPTDQAVELVADISDHLGEAIPAGTDEAGVRTVLDRLGTPQELVAEAGGAPAAASPAPATPPDGLGVVEILALVGLIAAELIFFMWPLAIVLWVAGIVLLAVARRWSGRQKLYGFLGLATGFPVLFVTLLTTLFVSGPTEACSGESVVVTSRGDQSAQQVQCSPLDTGTPGWVAFVALGFFVAYLVFQVWTVWRLTRRR